MAKSSYKQIEEDEQKIIRQLMEDSRQSPQEIAERCGFSRQKVWRIINKLEDSNKLWGYTAVVDDDQTGRKTYFALFKTKGPFYSIIKEVINALQGEKKADQLGINLLGIYYLNGIYDWLLVFSAKDIRIAKLYVGYAQKNYGKNLERIDLMDCVFPLIKFGKVNLNIGQLKEFAIS